MRAFAFMWITTCVFWLHIIMPRFASGIPVASPLIQQENQELIIVSYHVQTLVISRYAVTTISCKVKNPSQMPQESVFSVLLPGTSFVSNLTIEAGGRNYSSMVKEREEARQTYEKAVEQGSNAAIIHQKERETSRFRIDVSVAAQEEVTFYLSYEELLHRVLGNYTLRINMHPNYPVRDIFIDVTIHETRPISLLQVMKVPGGDDFLSAVSEWREGDKTARLQFAPESSSLPEAIPLHGQLVIQYDMDRSLDAGDIQIEDGYFVHFFAPADLQHLQKHITFVIDTSGSMSGSKMDQVKEALRRILQDLHKGDAFTIITFSSSARRVVDTTRFSPSAARRAQKEIDNLEATGGTNIDDGLKAALNPDGKVDPSMSQIIVLLTDGQATTGEINRNKILSNARVRNKYGASVFCLGFGTNADMDLMHKIALQNGGHSQKIYEDYDGADQLKNFYQSLSTPLLLDVAFTYSKDAVILESVSNTQFYNYFQGTELVVTGQMQPSELGVRANITGQGRNGEFTMGVTDWNTVLPPDHHLIDHLNLNPTPRNFIRRLWAFLMVKDLLDQEKAAVKPQARSLARRKALHLALQYEFVTPLTSLVVVEPNSERCKDYEDDYEEYYGDPNKDLSRLDSNDISSDSSDPSSTGPDEPLDPDSTIVEGTKEDEDRSSNMIEHILSPRIYGQYGDSHPDDNLLNKVQHKTYFAFTNSNSKFSLSSQMWFLCSLVHFLCWIATHKFSLCFSHRT